jgi:hypothetical protein
VAKLCGRPGCSEPGAVAYGMVPEDLLFWIDALDGAVAADVAVLCRRHANAMVVPRGWTLDDRRESVPRLFRATGEDTASQRRPRRRRRAGGATGAADVAADVASGVSQQLDLELACGGRELVTDPEPEPWQPEPWRPAFDVDDDLDGLLEVRSPLLARAFRGTGRRRA